MSSGARHVWTVADVANVAGPGANVRNYLEQRGVRRCLEAAAAVKPIKRACDVGCGYGRLTMVLTEFASEVAGFEREPGLMQVASGLVPAVMFRKVESRLSLPATSGSFEFAMTFTVLQHLNDSDAKGTLSEMKRLARGGFVLLTEETDPALVHGSEESGMFTRGRSEQTYCEWMRPYELILHFAREIEPGYPRNNVGTFMLFADGS